MLSRLNTIAVLRLSANKLTLFGARRWFGEQSQDKNRPPVTSKRKNKIFSNTYVHLCRCPHIPRIIFSVYGMDGSDRAANHQHQWLCDNRELRSVSCCCHGGACIAIARSQ